MNIELYLSFILASVILIIVPGPNVLLVISTSVSHGVQKGLLTVLATSMAMALQLLIIALGTTWLVASLTEGFQYLRWFGIAYLLYMGVIYLRAYLRKINNKAQVLSTSETFVRGFVVSLANPKTIFFFSAFFPQFITANGIYHQQFIVLSVTFLFIAMLLDSLYAVLAGRVRVYFDALDLQRLHYGISSVLFISAGIWLFFARRE